jgi:geranylgeranyl diphosphate synthase type I
VTVTGPSTVDLAETLVRPQIRSLLNRLNPRTKLVCGYHAGYWDATGAPSDTGGKGVRATIALLSAKATGLPAERGVPAAVAVELAHDFSLLHDDVMDADLVRRHRPAAWTVFGKPAAILAGDALIMLAGHVLISCGEPGGVQAAHRLSADVLRLIGGQTADLEFEQRHDITIDECLDMAMDKTGALMSCSAALGALLCAAPADVVQALSRFGAHLGLAFQFVDDLLGIWGDPERTGKPVSSDLRRRKKSLPVVRAATTPTRAGEAFTEIYRLPRELTESELKRAADLIEQTGARAWAEQEADRLTRFAIEALDEAEIADDARRELTDLALSMTKRDR